MQRNSETTPLFDVDSLVAGYAGVSVLSEVTFSVSKGEFIAICGPNGAGKSTLLRALAGLLQPFRGKILFLGRPLDSYPRRQLARQIAVVFQDFSCPYEFTIHDLVALGRSPFAQRLGSLSLQDSNACRIAMEMTDVQQFGNRSFFELSAGEQQRVLLAKALAQEPSALLLDEPSTHLDLFHQTNLFSILQHLNQQKGTTIVCVTQDITLAAQYVGRFIFLKNGRLINEGDPTITVTQSRMEELFETSLWVGLHPEDGFPFVYPRKR